MRPFLTLFLSTSLALLCAAAWAWRPVPPAERPRVDEPGIVLRLPPGATGLRDLGGDWYLFTLRIEGRDRRFLYRRGVEGHWGPCVTELQP